MIPESYQKFKPTTWERRFNPLFMGWWRAHFDNGFNQFRAETEHKWELVRAHSFAVPCRNALWRIERNSRRGVVEIGAGTGYWAHLLRLLLRPQGKGILAFDKTPAPSQDNPYVFTRSWYDDMVRADHTVLRDCRLTDSMTLFLCWPPYDDPHDWPAEALNMYQGDTVAYVGEGVGGCTGGEAFHRELEASWDCVETVAIPRWASIDDSLQIYKRKRS